MEKLEDTLLWKTFAKKATDEQRALVRKYAEKAAQRLTFVRDTFPTYTLHNELHSLNVIETLTFINTSRCSKP